MPPLISFASVHDVSQLTQLENEAFTCDRITARQFRYLITTANSLFLKAEETGKIYGYIVLLKRRTSKKIRLYSIAVAAFAQKTGIATLLLACAEETAKKSGFEQITLEVCESNIAAIQLYLLAGFNEYGKKSEYYEDGCTARLFRKILHPKGES